MSLPTALAASTLAPVFKEPRVGFSIDEAEARKRSQAIAKEAEFYGAMDGAARFSQRDSLATILIMAINIIAGFLIGVFQQGVPFQEALRTYTILTVGDGLVTIDFPNVGQKMLMLKYAPLEKI